MPALKLINGLRNITLYGFTVPLVTLAQMTSYMAAQSKFSKNVIKNCKMNVNEEKPIIAETRAVFFCPNPLSHTIRGVRAKKCW